MFGSILGAMTGMGGGKSPAQPDLKETLLSRALNGPKPPTQSNGIWARMINGPKQPPQGPPQGAQPQGPPMGMPQQPPPMAGPVPSVPPSPPSRVPPAVERFTNGQQIQQAYANGWNPNPMLLRAALGK